MPGVIKDQPVGHVATKKDLLSRMALKIESPVKAFSYIEGSSLKL